MRLSPNYAQYDDEKLIRLIAQSQEGALAQLYDRYGRLVFSIALMIIDDRLTAEEITLDVFMRVWQKAGSYRSDQAKVSTWLTHITRHHAIDVLRRRSVRLDDRAVHWNGLMPNAVSSEPDPQESAELSIQRERVQAAMNRLPSDQKQALGLAYFGGLTQSEIAKLLKQPLGTIKTRLRLAMKKLRGFLQSEGEPDDKSVEALDSYNIEEEQ